MAANEDFCLVRMFMKFEEYLIFDWYMVFLRNIFSKPELRVTFYIQCVSEKKDGMI